MQSIIIIHVYKKVAYIFRELSFFCFSIYKKFNEINILNKKSKNLLNRNKIFENKHKGKRAFVIVNGPSLKNQNLHLLKNDITFVVSAFYKHDVIETWQPTYYSILDKTFFENTEKSKFFFKEIKEKIHSSTFFIPYFRGYKANIERNLLPLDQTYYIATAGLPNEKIDLSNVVQSFQSVSAFALSQAIYMGCSEIYLLGFDHDYLAYRGIDRHFYIGGTLKGHISSNTPLSEMYTYEEEMKSCLKLWKNYRFLKKSAQKRGIKIYNATEGGYLDVFERISYESLFQIDELK